MAKNEDKEFQFDNVMDMDTDQLTSYETIGEPILNDILNGYNSTLMAYGQTGSGKTFTVFGSRNSIDTIGKTGPLVEEMGVVPRIIENLFDFIQQNPKNAQFRITTSFLQIYMEQITDLLAPMPFGETRGTVSSRGGTGSKSLTIKEDPKTGIFVHGLTLKKIRSKEELLNIIKRGARFRSTNATTMNKNSSRSHAILQVFVEQRWVESGEALNGDLLGDSDGKPTKKRSHRKALMTIVDLAGSERVSKSGSEGTRLAEAKAINKAISALGNCIVALSKKRNGRNAYVPFRDSKLTRILTESLSGNSKTIICACISPSVIHFDESLSTLLFAAKSMSVRIFAIKNENVEYKIQKPKNERKNNFDKDTDGMRETRDMSEKYIRMKEENEELKTRVDELENRYQRHSTADPMPDKNGQYMVRSRSPAPSYSDRNDLMGRKVNSMIRREDGPIFNNASGTIATSQYYDNYASPATKSAMSDRSWIDRNEVVQNASNEQAQLTIEKLTKVVQHLQNEYARNLLVIEELMQENRQLSQRADSSYYRDFN